MYNDILFPITTLRPFGLDIHTDIFPPFFNQDLSFSIVLFKICMFKALI